MRAPPKHAPLASRTGTGTGRTTAPVASAPDVMALVCQTAMNFFRPGWIQGGKADLTTVRPSYMGDYLHARGRVKAREELPDGSVRLICDVTVVDQRGETKVAGSVSGLV